MSTIVLDDPTTWNRPGWADNSCYANSALWALLYNDSFYDLINTPINTATSDLNFYTIDKKGKTTENILKTIDIDNVNTNRKLIRTGLIGFYDNIHNYNKKIDNVYSNTQNIRTALSVLENSNLWLKNPMDPSDFLRLITNIYDLTNVKNELLSRETGQDNTKMFLPYINLPINYTIENTDNKNIKVIDRELPFLVTNTYEFKSCDSLILDYPKIRLTPNIDLNASFDEIKIHPIDKYKSIGSYDLYAFLHWSGGGHYVCYFKVNGDWYMFDDLANSKKGNIVKVDDFININQEIIFNQSFLFFYKINTTIVKNSGNVLLSTVFKYDIKAEQDKIAAAAKTQPAKTSSTTAKTPTTEKKPTTFTSSVQIVNNCEKYGEDWLNLFINENAVPGSTTMTTGNDGTTSANFKNKQNGKLSTVDVPANCTFIPQTDATAATSATAEATAEATEQEEGAAASISRTSSTGTLGSVDAYKQTEITGNLNKLENVDFEKVYNTVNSEDTNNGKPIQIFLVYDNGYISDEYLHSNGNINSNNIEKNTEEKTDLLILPGIFLKKDTAKKFSKNIKKNETKAVVLATEADKALKLVQQKVELISDENVKNIIQNATFDGSQTDIAPISATTFPKTNDDQLVYFKKNVYVVGTVNKNKNVKFLYNVNDNKIYDLDGIRTVTDTGFNPLETPKLQKKGGTRKRNKNISGGTRRKGKRHLRKTKKLRKCKRTKKHIRDKNKLKTNKLRKRKS